jgi:putative restriction endonuclease
VRGKISERIQLRPMDLLPGYVTISKDCHFEVSKRIKEEFENGRDYYAMHGRSLYLPPDRKLRPGSQFIEWHNENVFRG